MRIPSLFMVLLLSVGVFSGCGKEKQEMSASLEVEMQQPPAELPVLTQNQVAPNPFLLPPKEEASSFDQVSEEPQERPEGEEETVLSD